jgi:hypothetical protein
MRRTQRWSNVLVSFLSVASSLAVLASDLVVAGYREHYGDALPFVVGYTALQAWFLVAFVRQSPWMPWITIAKALGAYVFLLTFTVIGPAWMAVTPSRYVYLLFDWGPSTKIGMFAFVFLGRGAWNTFNAFMATEPWWRPLRSSRPLLGRLVTLAPVAVIVLCVWAFLTLVKLDAKTFSPEAADVARLVLGDIDCATIRQRGGTTTTDVRQRGTTTYQVEIRYGCAATQVVVRAEDGRLGTASAARPECCADHASPTVS